MKLPTRRHRPTSRTSVAAAMAVLAAAALSACGGSADSSSAGDEMTFVVADQALTVATASYTSVPLQAGYFEEEGLDVTVQPVDSALSAVQSIATGQGFMTYASTAAAASAVAKDPDLRVVGLTNGNIFRVVVPEDSDVTEAEDLAGKTIGVGSTGGSSEIYARGIYQVAGLDPDEDASFLPIGFGAQAADAFRKGDVDAYAGWDAPNLVIGDILGTEFRDVPSPLNELTATSALVVSKESIEDDRDKVVGAARAFFKGMIFTEANPAAAVDMHWEEFPQSRANEGDPEEEKRQAVRTVERRMELTAGPGDSGQFGEQDVELVQRTLDEFAKVGMITESLDLASSDLIDYALVEDYNDFDPQAVVDEAKAQQE